MRIECPHCSARVRLDEPPDDDTPIRCPECRKKFVPPDDDDRPARKKKGGRRREEDEEKKGRGVQFAIAGGVVALAAVVGIVVVVMVNKKDDPKPVAAANTNPDPAPTPPRPTPTPTPQPQQPQQQTPTPTPKKGTGPDIDPDKNLNGKGGTPTTVVQAAQPIPPQYVELFRQTVSVPPRTIRAASLRPTAAETEPEVPTFHSLMLARKKGGDTPAPAPKAAKMTIEEVKKACTYIKVDAGDISGTGSGFLIGTDGKSGLVATNHHVIAAAARPRYTSKAPTVTVVFNSGIADEKSMKADIIAYDDVADVAILRVEGPGPWPKPINPYNALPKVTEGVDIQFWGFPKGAALATSAGANPAITLGKGNVASLRYTPSGKLDRVQINGTLNPGNSGGPLVDNDGRLVGLAVSGFKVEFAVGIGFAVPVDDLIALLEGRLMTTIFVPVGFEGGKAKFFVIVPVMDPMDRVDTVFVRRWAGGGSPPEAVRDPLTGHKPFGMRKDGKANLPGVEEFPLKKFRTEGGSASGLGIALGEMDVPEGSPQVLIQVASQTFPNAAGTKYTAASKPVAYTLSVGDQAMATDAQPIDRLTANPDSLTGQVVVVKGRIAAPPITRDAVQELIIVGLDGRRPDKMRFLVDRHAATQFDEVVPEDQPKPVRLVCVVGQRGADGILPVRVARLDFIGRADRVTRTIPSAPKVDDQLAELNRDPARFAGRTLELKVESVPIHPRALSAGEYAVVFPSAQQPRNLAFNLTPDMRQRLIQGLDNSLRPGTMVRSRVTVVVPDRPVPAGGRAPLTLTKIEFLDAEGRPVKTFE